MEKLFIALRDKYEGAEVRDVKFVVNPEEVADQSVDDIDAQLAAVVREAKPIAEAVDCEEE